jgi:hypothetical protein
MLINSRVILRHLTAAVLIAGALTSAQAGQNCEEHPLTVATVDASMRLAERTARALDASGAQVVVLARAGRNLDRYGLRWSHLGYAYREGGNGRWLVVHKLNACGTAEGRLYRQGLGEFFLDGMTRYEAAYSVPSADLQARLLPILSEPARALALQHRPYNMVAYPWSTRYQQSNQWALETLAMAAEPTVRTRERAQAWLRFQGYQPTVLQVGALERLGARVSTAHIAFDDHPNGERYSDRIATVTVDSVYAFLATRGLAGPVQLVS